LNTDAGIKNEGQYCKIGPVREWVLVDEYIEEIKEGEYGRGTLYT
jgi:hypothetical protein